MARAGLIKALTLDNDGRGRINSEGEDYLMTGTTDYFTSSLVPCYDKGDKNRNYAGVTIIIISGQHRSTPSVYLICLLCLSIVADGHAAMHIKQQTNNNLFGAE